MHETAGGAVVTITDEVSGCIAVVTVGELLVVDGPVAVVVEGAVLGGASEYIFTTTYLRPTYDRRKYVAKHFYDRRKYVGPDIFTTICT